jgi:hypothetical protein
MKRFVEILLSGSMGFDRSDPINRFSTVCNGEEKTMKPNRAYLCHWMVPWVLGTAFMMGQINQDALRMSRTLESNTLEVWQSAQARFQQLSNNNRLSEDDLSLYFNLNAFSKSATLFRELASLNNLTQLRGGIQSMIRQAVEIENLFDKSTGFARQFNSWRNVQNSLETLAQSVNLPYAPLSEISQAPQSNPNQGSRDRSLSTQTQGRIWWRGVVDGSDRIRFRGDQVTIEHLDAQPIRDATYDISTSLPRRAMVVTLRPIRGRGRMQIIEQPSSSNRYSAIVLVEDPKGGTDTYEFELLWEATESNTSRIPRP